MDAEQVPTLLKSLTEADLEFRGFHVFAGSQNLRADVLRDSQRETVELIRRLADAAPAPVRYLNLGGGFGIPYFSHDQPLDLEAVGTNLARLQAESIHPAFPSARILIEPGRYIVGECGVYVTRVLDRKQSRGKTFLVVDGGLHHQLAASGNLGQVIRRNYPLAIGNRLDEEPTEGVTVVGCLCTPLDLLGNDVQLAPAEIGDLVIMRTEPRSTGQRSARSRGCSRMVQTAADESGCQRRLRCVQGFGQGRHAAMLRVLHGSGNTARPAIADEKRPDPPRRLVRTSRTALPRWPANTLPAVPRPPQRLAYPSPRHAGPSVSHAVPASPAIVAEPSILVRFIDNAGSPTNAYGVRRRWCTIARAHGHMADRTKINRARPPRFRS